MKEYSTQNHADFRAYAPLPELRLPITPTSEENPVGPLFQNWERIETATGEKIYLSPTREVPVESLIPSNWDHITAMSKFRTVRSIDTLTDGTNPHLVVKSPERVFTRLPEKLDKGEIWWGGLRSGEKGLDLRGIPAVEAQVEREAIILLALREAGIPVELPQAMITLPDGTRQLVVNEIRQTSHPADGGVPSSFSQRRLKQYGFLPHHTTGRLETLRDTHGNDVIVGVHRWQIPPHTNSYQQNLITAVTQAVEAFESVRK